MVYVNEWRNNVARVCSGMVLKLDALVLLDEDEAWPNIQLSLSRQQSLA